MARFWSGIAVRRDLRVDVEIYRKRHAGICVQRGRVAMACILALALCAMGFIGCAQDEGPLAQDDGPANASTSDEYVLASSYGEIYQTVRASLDEDAGVLDSGDESSSDTQQTEQMSSSVLEGSVDEVAAEAMLTEEDLLAEFGFSWDISVLEESQDVLSIAALSDIAAVKDESGYIYVVVERTLSVLCIDDSSTELVEQLSMGAYDELERWESVDALYLEDDILAVLGSLAEDSDWDPDAPDYALSAYAGARVTLAFFDVSDPSDPEYLSALGVTGTLLGFVESDGVLTVVASRSAVPAVSSDTGGWLVVEDEEDAEGTSYPTRQEVIDRLELRRNDAVSYVPAVYQDGSLTPVAADRVYLPADGTGAIATVVATFDLKNQSAASAFAVYFDELEGATVTIGTGVLYLQWESPYTDEEADKEAETSGTSIFIMRVPLEGAALSGVMGMERVEGVEGDAQDMLSSLWPEDS